MLYVLGDADRVREKVEAALFRHDLAGLTAFSQTMTGAIATLVREMGERLGAQTVMAGGDDVLFTVDADRFDADVLTRFAAAFASATGCSISFGIGVTPDAAYLNLRRAKAAGGRVVSQDSLG
ncbi:Cas10/Cmr2 second palm domain-containing protein [Roseixanthobacter liquoris]|uniref:Cas10/Cmr2 second palm domain-containing protein n=1 Tax=Roseixanthobacter liquoris TaxID=3119921 RepID=UPI003727FE42